MAKAKLLGLVVLFILIFSNLAFAISDSNGDGIISLGELFGGTSLQSTYTTEISAVQDCNDPSSYKVALYKDSVSGQYCTFGEGKTPTTGCGSTVNGVTANWQKVSDCPVGTTTTPSSCQGPCPNTNEVIKLIDGVCKCVSSSTTTQCYGPCPNIADEYKYINGQCQCVPKSSTPTPPTLPPVTTEPSTPPSTVVTSGLKFRISPDYGTLSDSIFVGSEKEIVLEFRNDNPNSVSLYLEAGIYNGGFALENGKFLLDKDVNVFSISPTIQSLPPYEACVQKEGGENGFVRRYKLDLSANENKKAKILIKSPSYLSQFESGRYNYVGFEDSNNKPYFLYLNVFNACTKDGGNSVAHLTKAIIVQNSLIPQDKRNLYTLCGSDGKDCLIKSGNVFIYAKEGEQCGDDGPYCNTPKGYDCISGSGPSTRVCKKTGLSEQEKRTSGDKATGNLVKSASYKYSDFKDAPPQSQLSAMCTLTSQCEEYVDYDYPNLKYNAKCTRPTQIKNILKEASKDVCKTEGIFDIIRCNIANDATLDQGACIATRAAGQAGGFGDSITEFFSGFGDSFSNLSSTSIIIIVVIIGIVLLTLVRK